MNKKPGSLIIPLAVWISLLLGCQTTEPINRRLELEQATGTMTVITQDTTVYTLDQYLVKDSTLRGVGLQKRNGIQNSFSGSLPLSEISYVQVSHADGMRTILAVAAAGFVMITAGSYINLVGEPGLRLDPNVRYVYPYSGGGGGSGSCPYLYSWNGERFVLEAEAFGIAWGRALEIQTSSVLPSLRPDNGMVRIAISNERPETHYVNSVRLKAVETDPKAEVITDDSFNIWAVNSPVAPSRATDHSHRELTELLAAPDGKCWESSLANTTFPSTFEDTVEAAFARTSDQKEGTLIIRGINTKLNEVVFKNLFAFLGDQSLEFVRAVEHDQELINILRDWIEAISLKVSVWNGKEWDEVSSIRPEANSVSFTKACRINLKDVGGDKLKIRLTSLSDVWKLDAVQIDWTVPRPLVPLDVTLTSADGPGHRDVSGELRFADNKYLVLLPPERIDLKFEAVQPQKGKKMTYVIDVRGYLHEWITPAETTASVIPAKWVKDAAKITYLKAILRLKNVFLPPLYVDWKQCRNAAPDVKIAP